VFESESLYPKAVQSKAKDSRGTYKQHQAYTRQLQESTQRKESKRDKSHINVKLVEEGSGKRDEKARRTELVEKNNADCWMITLDTSFEETKVLRFVVSFRREQSKLGPVEQQQRKERKSERQKGNQNEGRKWKNKGDGRIKPLRSGRQGCKFRSAIAAECSSREKV
jgi:hypothetical protein